MKDTIEENNRMRNEQLGNRSANELTKREHFAAMALGVSDGADWNHPNPEGIIELCNKRNKQKERDDKLTQLGI